LTVEIVVVEHSFGSDS